MLEDVAIMERMQSGEKGKILSGQEMIELSHLIGIDDNLDEERFDS